MKRAVFFLSLLLCLACFGFAGCTAPEYERVSADEWESAFDTANLTNVTMRLEMRVTENGERSAEGAAVYKTARADGDELLYGRTEDLLGNLFSDREYYLEKTGEGEFLTWRDSEEEEWMTAPTSDLGWGIADDLSLYYLGLQDRYADFSPDTSDDVYTGTIELTSQTQSLTPAVTVAFRDGHVARIELHATATRGNGTAYESETILQFSDYGTTQLELPAGRNPYDATEDRDPVSA